MAYLSLMYVDGIADAQRATGTAILAPPELSQRNELGPVVTLISGLDILLTVNCTVRAITAACGGPTIQLECCYLILTNGRGSLFGSLYPCPNTDQQYDRSDRPAPESRKISRIRRAVSEISSAHTVK